MKTHFSGSTFPFSEIDARARLAKTEILPRPDGDPDAKLFALYQEMHHGYELSRNPAFNEDETAAAEEAASSQYALAARRFLATRARTPAGVQLKLMLVLEGEVGPDQERLYENVQAILSALADLEALERARAPRRRVKRHRAPKPGRQIRGSAAGPYLADA